MCVLARTRQRLCPYPAAAAAAAVCLVLEQLTHCVHAAVLLLIAMMLVQPAAERCKRNRMYEQCMPQAPDVSRC